MRNTDLRDNNNIIQKVSNPSNIIINNSRINYNNSIININTNIYNDNNFNSSNNLNDNIIKNQYNTETQPNNTKGKNNYYIFHIINIGDNNIFKDNYNKIKIFSI